MSLLDAIRADLVNESANLSNTLRKAKILASEIGLPEFREWVDFELSGYPDRDSVPTYRRFRPINLGTFSGPFRSFVRDMVLPTSNLPDDVKELAENLAFVEGVGELEAQVSESRELAWRWPQEMVMLAQESTELSGGMILVDARQPVPTHVISGVIDQVKTRLLDFVLALQESNVTSEDLDNRTVAPEVARNLFINNIYGDHNIVGSGEQVNQRVNTVQKGDIDSLLGFLREFNIDDDDLGELKDAVSSEPIAPDGNHGPKVQAWLGGMISKAASGTWNVGVQVASKVLTDALKGYYGH